MLRDILIAIGLAITKLPSIVAFKNVTSLKPSGRTVAAGRPVRTVHFTEEVINYVKQARSKSFDATANHLRASRWTVCHVMHVQLLHFYNIQGVQTTNLKHTPFGIVLFRIKLVLLRQMFSAVETATSGTMKILMLPHLYDAIRNFPQHLGWYCGEELMFAVTSFEYLHLSPVPARCFVRIFWKCPIEYKMRHDGAPPHFILNIR